MAMHWQKLKAFLFGLFGWTEKTVTLPSLHRPLLLFAWIFHYVHSFASLTHSLRLWRIKQLFTVRKCFVNCQCKPNLNINWCQPPFQELPPFTYLSPFLTPPRFKPVNFDAFFPRLSIILCLIIFELSISENIWQT